MFPIFKLDQFPTQHFIYCELIIFITKNCSDLKTEFEDINSFLLQMLEIYFKF